MTCFFIFQVRFSDEKRFLLYNDGPVGVWRRRGDTYKAKYVRGTTKNRKGLMAWLCIASDGTSKLIRCPDLMDSSAYQSQILSPNLNFIRRPGSATGNTYVFQQDGASCHTSRSTQAYLASHGVKVLTPWPAMSPDLNIVEHCWAWLSRQLIGRSFKRVDDLWDAIVHAWDNRPASLIRNLYGSMIRRLTAVQVAKGGNTRY